MLTCERLSRRQMLVGLPACALVSSVGFAAWGGAAVPISLPELVALSHSVVVGVPQEASSYWEGKGDARRIVTYSRLEVLQPLDGRPPADTQLYVRTLGGKVGEIGQIVHGEAALDLHRPAVLFLRGDEPGSFAVTAMAQGHFPIADDDTGTARLRSSPRLADFVVKDPRGAVSRLRGRSVLDCEQLVLEELAHAR